MIDDDEHGIIHTPGLDDYARSAKPDGALGNVAELVRRLLVCTAVVIRIDGVSGTVVALGKGCSAAGTDADTLADPVTAGDAGYQFYAGIPLRTAAGRNFGVLAALDEAPRRLSETELDTLKLAAALAVEVVALREALVGAAARSSRAAL